MHLGRVLGGILHVVPEKFTQTTEFSLASVFEAELESLQSSGLVHNLKASIVLQDLKHGPVGFPQKLEPWSHDSAVGTVLRLLARYSGQKDGFGSFDGFEVVNIG